MNAAYLDFIWTIDVIRTLYGIFTPATLYGLYIDIIWTLSNGTCHIGITIRYPKKGDKKLYGLYMDFIWTLYGLYGGFIASGLIWTLYGH